MIFCCLVICFLFPSKFTLQILTVITILRHLSQTYTILFQFSVPLILRLFIVSSISISFQVGHKVVYLNISIQKLLSADHLLPFLKHDLIVFDETSYQYRVHHDFYNFLLYILRQLLPSSFFSFYPPASFPLQSSLQSLHSSSIRASVCQSRYFATYNFIFDLLNNILELWNVVSV